MGHERAWTDVFTASMLLEQSACYWDNQHVIGTISMLLEQSAYYWDNQHVHFTTFTERDRAPGVIRCQNQEYGTYVHVYQLLVDVLCLICVSNEDLVLKYCYVQKNCY